jgi:hypothetical protein
MTPFTTYSIAAAGYGLGWIIDRENADIWGIVIGGAGLWLGQ